jgi:hypothetical protein
MKVETQAVWCDNEKDLKLLSVSLIDPTILCADATSLDLFLRAVNVRDQDRRAVLRSITPGDGEPDLYAVPLEDHGGVRLGTALYFLQPECR